MMLWVIPMNEEPFVSIIIPTYNSEKTLEKCLISIDNQTYANIETIIVDGGSEDKTIEFAQKMGARAYIKKGCSMSAATNFGINISGGKYIYRVDSDVILDKTIVEEAVHKCEDEGYDGVCIFWLPDESVSFWAKIRKMEKESYTRYPNYVGRIKYDKNVLGARFLKRKVLDGVGKLDEEVPTAGEDYALYDKLAKTNFRFATIAARERHIGEPKTIRDIIRKQYYYGKTINFFLKKNKTKGLIQLSPVRIPLLKNWKNFLMHPILTVGFLFYEIVVYTSSISGYLTVALQEWIKSAGK